MEIRLLDIYIYISFQIDYSFNILKKEMINGVLVEDLIHTKEKVYKKW